MLGEQNYSWGEGGVDRACRAETETEMRGRGGRHTWARNLCLHQISRFPGAGRALPGGEQSAKISSPQKRKKPGESRPRGLLRADVLKQGQQASSMTAGESIFSAFGSKRVSVATAPPHAPVAQSTCSSCVNKRKGRAARAGSSPGRKLSRQSRQVHLWPESPACGTRAHAYEQEYQPGPEQRFRLLLHLGRVCRGQKSFTGTSSSSWSVSKTEMFAWWLL